MPEKEFLELLDELFEQPPGTTRAVDSLTNHPAWSSLTFVGLIAMVDEECGVTLAPDDVRQCETIGDLVTLLGEAVVPEKRAA